MSGVEDIEDLVGIDDVTPEERYSSRKMVVPRARNRRNELAQGDSIIPGTQKIYVRTWGCSHNNSDGEYMAGQLAAYGYKIVDDKKDADLWLLNSCTVKNPAEDHFRNEINAAQSLGKKIVVAGCVPQGERKSGYLQGLSVIGVQQIDRVVEVVEETLKGHSVRLFGAKKEFGRKVGGARLDLPKIRKNPLIEIIAINTGCLNQCTYCKTKHARGELGSYPPEEIVARAEQSFSEGVVEIWLTSEDTGAYGKDIGVTLPQLLWQLVEVIPEGCMLRLGMTNPPYILEHLEEMAKILNHPRVYSFLHVPVQAGSDNVLMDMKREYNVEDFMHVVDFLKERVYNVNIATDLICGFPTETEEDFEGTMQLVDKYRFASLFINQFFPRPGTPAAKMERIPAQTVKKRTKRVSELFQSYEPYGHKVGEIQDVLITEISTDKRYYVGHNKSYDQVLVSMENDLMGRLVKVKITEAGKHFMKCHLVGTDTESSRPAGVAQPLPKGQVSGVDNPSETMKPSTTHPLLVLSLLVLIVSILLKIYYSVLVVRD